VADGGLDLTPEKMRELGYAAVDAVVEHLTTLRDGPTFTPPPPDLAERIMEPPPEDGADPVELLGWLRSEVLSAGVRNHHPGMFAFIPVAPTFPGVVADMLAAGMNVFAGSFQSGPGASVVEIEVLGWFRELLGLDASADGVIASGGSTANLVGLAVARDRRPDGGPDRVAYTTTEAHSSLGRALKVLGIDRVREVDIDERFRMRPEALSEAMAADAAAGLVPWCVIAAAGTTNTGAVDDLPALRRVADERGAWLHVDAAYGGFLALTERGRAAMPGLGLADTLVLDAHKSLYCPLLAGIVFARDGADLERTFTVRPAYLKDMDRYGGVNFADRGIELSRPFRALKVWLTVKTFGLGEIRAALDRTLDLGLLAAELIEQSPRLDLVTGPSLGVVNFRSAAGVAVERMMAEVIDAGAYISATTVHGERTARICVLGHRSDEAALRSVVEAAAAAD
jgi:glutamate/tyrosine decarboxylase-like PLP-dependent enzyme